MRENPLFSLTLQRKYKTKAKLTNFMSIILTPLEMFVQYYLYNKNNQTKKECLEWYWVLAMSGQIEQEHPQDTTVNFWSLMSLITHNMSNNMSVVHCILINYLCNCLWVNIQGLNLVVQAWYRVLWYTIFHECSWKWVLSW